MSSEALSAVNDAVYNIVSPIPTFFNDTVNNFFPGLSLLFTVLLAAVLGWFIMKKTRGGWPFFFIMTIVFFGFLRWLGFGG